MYWLVYLQVFVFSGGASGKFFAGFEHVFRRCVDQFVGRIFGQIVDQIFGQVFDQIGFDQDLEEGKTINTMYIITQPGQKP